MAATPSTVIQDNVSTDAIPFPDADRQRTGFFIIDNDVLDRFGPQLGPTGIAVYSMLARCADRSGRCFPAQATIAERIGMSRMQVSREINKLTKLGLITVEQRFADSGAQRSNLYVVLSAKGVSGRDRGCRSPLHPPVTERYTPCRRTLHKQDSSIKNNTHPEEDPEQPPPHRQLCEEKNSVSAVNEGVVVALRELGISQNVAHFLASCYSQERIDEKVAYLKFLQAAHPQKVQNPRGWLRRAIEQDYSPPDGFLTPAEREEEAAACAEMNQVVMAQMHAALQMQQEVKREEAARPQQLTQQYGTLEADLAFWQEVQQEIHYGTLIPFAALLAKADMLNVEQAVVTIGVRYKSDWMALQHPGTRTAIGRAPLSLVAGKSVELEAVLLASKLM